MKQLILSLFITGALMMGVHNNAMSQNSNKIFQSLIKQYEQSINQADTILAAALGSKSDEVSFINPRSTEYGWNGIKNIIKMFADNFTKRELHGFNEKVSVYGDVAWLTFEWVFDATFKSNNQPLQTKGRETQIWHQEKGTWKLVHVHYSNMPVTAEGQGF